MMGVKIIKKDKQIGDAAKLRRQAEKILWEKAAQKPEIDKALLPVEVDHLLHELQVHQIELEMQNDELRRTLAELEDSHTRYFDFYNLAPVGYLTLNKAGSIIEANLTMATFLGADRRNLIGQFFSHFIVPADQDSYYFHRRVLYDSSVPQTCELRLVKKGGDPFWTQLQSVVIKGPDNVPVHRIVVSDITARKQADEMMHESEQKYRLLADNTFDWEYWLKPDGNYEYISPSCGRITGYSAGEFIKNPRLLFDICSKESKELIEKHFKDHRVASGKIHVFEFSIKHKNGDKIWLEHSCRPVYDYKGEFAGRRGINYDITKRKRVEINLKKSQKQFRSLSHQLKTTLEDERTRISRQIHDGLGQALTALKIDIADLKDQLSDNEIQVKNNLKNMLKQTDSMIQSVKKISTDLRPSILDHLGLASAIEWNVDEFQKKTGIHCHLNINLVEIDLKKSVAVELYRILQETLTNVVRHSQAKNVDIKLTLGPKTLLFTIRDDGIGFDRAKIDYSSNLGLLGIRERAYSIKGKLNISARKGTGTTIKVMIPLKNCKDV